MKTNPPQIAADFIDAYGIRNTTIQILNNGGKVIWLADLEDGVPTRILATKRLFDCKENFLGQAKRLMKGNIPKKYS